MDYGLFCLNNRVPADGMAAPEEGFMKKIVIAGNSGSTENYAEALTRLGASCTVTTDCRFAGDFDALLLPGGGDIDPVLFGESDHGSRKIEPGLDRKQLAMLDAFVRLSRPVLGICKGMQIINVYFGGGVIQDLPTNYAHQYDGRDQVHPSHAVPGSIFHQLYGADFNVNSAHHQGIGSPGRGLSVVQYAPDGVAEGIVHENLPVICVQWHPERMCFARRREDTPDGSLLLSHFLSLTVS